MSSSERVDPTARLDVLGELVGELDPDTRRTLLLVAVPHWVPSHAIFSGLYEHGLLESLAELIRRRLVRRLGSGDLEAAPRVRGALIEQELAGDRSAWQTASNRWADLFKRMPGVPAAIEAIYHRIGVDPLAGSQAMFRLVRRLSVEPHFDFDAVRRALEVWREHEGRGLIRGGAEAYLRASELRDVSGRRRPAEELSVLETIKESLPDDPEFNFEVNLHQGLALTSLGRMDEAWQKIELAARDALAAQDIRAFAAARRACGRMLIRADNFKAAAISYGEAYDSAYKMGDEVGIAQALAGAAETEYFLGRHQDAALHFDEAIERFKASDGRFAEASARVTYSQMLAGAGMLGEARDHAQRAMQIYDPIGQRLGIANALKAEGTVALGEGRLEDARRLSESALAAYREWGSRTGAASANILLGRISGWEHRHDDAASSLEAAQATMPESERFGQATIKREYSVLLLRTGREQAPELLSYACLAFLEIGSLAEAWVTSRLFPRSPLGNRRRKLFDQEIEDAWRRLPDEGMKERAWLIIPPWYKDLARLDDLEAERIIALRRRERAV